MKSGIIVIAGIMAIAAPVFADEHDRTNYLIKYVNSDKAKDQVLREFNMYDVKESDKFVDDLFKSPKLFIKEGEDKNLYKKAK